MMLSTSKYSCYGFIQCIQWLCHYSKHFKECTVWNLATESHDFCQVIVITLNLLPFNAIISFVKRKQSHGTVYLFWVPLQDPGMWRHNSFLLLTQQAGHKFGQTNAWSNSFKIIWTDPNEIPNMFATSQVVIPLFPMTSSFNWWTVSSLLLASGHLKHLASST